MQKQNMSPVAAGITGLILGIVGTAAVALSDKQTRIKATKKANDIKDKMEKWSKDTLHELQATGDDVKKRSAEKTETLESREKTSVDDVNEQAGDELKEEKKVL